MSGGLIKRAGALAVALGASKTVGHSISAPGARRRFNPSVDIPFDILPFSGAAADFGTDVQSDAPCTPFSSPCQPAARNLIPRAATAPSLTEVARPELNMDCAPAARHASGRLRHVAFTAPAQAGQCDQGQTGLP